MTELLRSYLLVALGSALGGVARFACGTLALRLGAGAFPSGTLAINIVGSAVIGAFAVLTGPEGRLASSPGLQQFVMVGLCGGYTTFSAFSLQSVELVREGAFGRAALYVAASVGLCMAATFCGGVFAAGLNAARAG